MGLAGVGLQRQAASAVRTARDGRPSEVTALPQPPPRALLGQQPTDCRPLQQYPLESAIQMDVPYISSSAEGLKNRGYDSNSCPWNVSRTLIHRTAVRRSKSGRDVQMAAEIIGIGNLLGGFRMEDELGRGRMGVVYKVHELSLNRKVALKVLSPRLSSAPEFIERFKREAQAIAALNHFNIVSILSYGEGRGSYYFAMEYMRGKDLGRILEEKRIMPVGEALSITAQVAGALGEADARGMVHRDLKPSNIMVDETRRVWITDFGLAHLERSGTQLTRTGLFLGTPELASPEQAHGGTLDARSDIYSLGAVLYRMLSGRPPFTGDSPIAVVVKVATEPVTPIGEVNPSVPEPIRKLIEKMIAKDLQERFQTPGELLEAIGRCQNSLQAGASPLTGEVSALATKSAVLHKRRTSVAVLAGIVGVALAVFLVVWIVEGGRRSPVPKQEQAPHQEPAPTPGPSPPAERDIPPPPVLPPVSEVRPGATDAQRQEVPPEKTPLRREPRTDKPKAA